MFSSQNSQVSSAANYIEDVFQTFLYTGNASTQTITNSIDFSTYGGLAWIKRRDQAGDNQLFDTVRGATKVLFSNSTGAQSTAATTLTSFTTSGYVLGADGNINGFGDTYTSWSFRKQPKFFDVVTYTGNGTNRNIAHNLGSTPAMIIVKQISSVQPWAVYHRSLSSGDYVLLNTTAAAVNNSTYFTTTAPTSTTFSVGTANATNANTQTYVAYLFAHNAGGFGLTGTDNVISCGSFVWGNTGTQTVNLGYEPQWILYKQATGIDAWRISDVMRGDSLTAQAYLLANSAVAEDAGVGAGLIYPTSTGFAADPGGGGQTYIYMAIRRGPMKVPTSGTSVYNALTYSGTGATRVLDASIVPDIYMGNTRTPSGGPIGLFVDRLRGNNTYIQTTSTGAESTVSPTRYFSGQTGLGLDTTADNVSGRTYVSWFMRRAPSFFDEVCYTGTGASTTDTIRVNHNLGVKPELLITKSRSAGSTNWGVYAPDILPKVTGNYTFLKLNLTDAIANSYYFDVTSTYVDYIRTGTSTNSMNDAGTTYVSYLFATCAGVSKVGSYTGTGTTKQVDCGFTGGARFVLIKRTDSTGDWYVWDTARGIVSGNDPYLLLNSTAAEVTSTDYIDTYSAGFEISSTAPAAINASGGSYIFLAVS